MPQNMLIEKTTGYTAHTPPPVNERKEDRMKHELYGAHEHLKNIGVANI
jgi:hypothetical protein